MTVYFIGAGPGAPDLITVRGQNLIERCPVCLYAGSLVPEAVVQKAPADALVMDTAPMHLDEILAENRSVSVLKFVPVFAEKVERLMPISKPPFAIAWFQFESVVIEELPNFRVARVFARWESD